MPTTYKVLGQAASTPISLSVTNKELTSNVATLTLSAAHTLVVGQQIQVALTTPEAAFDGVRTVTAVTSTTLSFASNTADVTSVAATGTLTAFEHSTLYTCPSATAAVVSTLTICNLAIRLRTTRLLSLTPTLVNQRKQVHRSQRCADGF